jgi:hypothetical protein
VLEGQTEAGDLWSIGRTCLWPNCLFTGGHFEWRVPVDDENTLSVVWSFIRVPKEAEPYVQESIPAWRSPTTDSNTGKWITSHVINQDIVAWVGQGAIADRTKEHLRSSDIGITLMRNRFFEEIEAIQAGRDPKGVVRDPGTAKSIDLPDMAHALNMVMSTSMKAVRIHRYGGPEVLSYEDDPRPDPRKSVFAGVGANPAKDENADDRERQPSRRPHPEPIQFPTPTRVRLERLRAALLCHGTVQSCEGREEILLLHPPRSARTGSLCRRPGR